MSQSSGNSLVNSLRGKIWISTSVLAFFICTFGLISYLVVTLLTSDPFYGVFIPFIFLAFSVIVFGWWLSNELVSPIENVTLLAKSLERNASTSLPKTSGSSETDQLLQTLHRNSQQIQNVITLMDKVANGNINVALTPLKGSDRLTSSFQRLLTKVSESIHAKDELNKLENEIEQIKLEISSVRIGNLDVEIESDYFKTKEITETLKYLIENLTLMISLIKVDSHQALHSASEVKDTMETLIQNDEDNIQEMNQASNALQQVPNLISKITESLEDSAKSAKHTIHKSRHGAEISHENSEAVTKLRSKLRKAVNRIQTLSERSGEIGKVAKTVEDLANRTNMIALNASIQATEFGEEGRSFVIVSEELERLAARANGTNKQISMLNNSILSEISKVEHALETTVGEVAGLSKYAIETSNVLGELERYIEQYLNLQENLIAFSKDQSEETDEAFETFVSSISETESKIKNLKDSSSQVNNILLMMKNLQMHTAEFRVTPKGEIREKQNEKPVSPPEFENEDSKQSSKEDLLYEEFANQEFTTEDFNNAKSGVEKINETPESPEEINSDNLEGTEFTSREFDSDEFTSQEFDSREFDSEEFNSQELNSDEFISDEFNSQELNSLEIMPEEPAAYEDLLLAESIPDDSDTNEISVESNLLDIAPNSNGIDYNEFMNDDVEIEEQKVSAPVPNESEVKNNFDENDDLLNLNPENNKDQNSTLSA